VSFHAAATSSLIYHYESTHAMLTYLLARWGEFSTTLGVIGAIVGLLILFGTLWLDTTALAAISDTLRSVGGAVLAAGLVAILIPDRKGRDR
jgi:flagellar motor component MotA